MKNHEEFCDSNKINFTKPSNKSSEQTKHAIHNGGHNNKCELCGKSFSGKTNLKYHIEKIHDKVAW